MFKKSDTFNAASIENKAKHKKCGQVQKHKTFIFIFLFINLFYLKIITFFSTFKALYLFKTKDGLMCDYRLCLILKKKIAFNFTITKAFLSEVACFSLLTPCESDST